MLLASCGGRTASSDSQPEEDSSSRAGAIDIKCTWNIENVVVNDTLYARPSEVTPGIQQTFTFAEESFGINTNCNNIGGEYTLKGDSISFSNMLITEMACDNEEVERLLLRVLPEINTLDCLNDSTLRLNSDSSAYIVLKK